jgi:hypothetical protein
LFACIMVRLACLHHGSCSYVHRALRALPGLQGAGQSVCRRQRQAMPPSDLNAPTPTTSQLAVPSPTPSSRGPHLHPPPNSILPPKLNRSSSHLNVMTRDPLTTGKHVWTVHVRAACDLVWLGVSDGSLDASIWVGRSHKGPGFGAAAEVLGRLVGSPGLASCCAVLSSWMLSPQQGCCR